MGRKMNLRRWKLRWVMLFLVVSACVEPIYFEVPPAELQLVVEGMITDSPGPYTVTLSKGLALDSKSSITNARTICKGYTV
jgi:hypothetical protein